jgi:hypothetical protein
MKGINFIEPLFRKVVSGEKTQTRRIVNPQPDEGIEIPEEGFIHFDGAYCGGVQRCQGWNYDDVDLYPVLFPVKPKYKPWETLYLKEPYCLECDFRQNEDGKEWTASGKILYRYGGDRIPGHAKDSFGKWQNRNKLFMPEKYARYYIRITDVRAERLQEISDEDCIKEGIIETCSIAEDYYDPVFENGIDMSRKINGGMIIQYDSPREAYAALIDKISGKGAWESNPFVWVYDFELTSK